MTHGLKAGDTLFAVYDSWGGPHVESATITKITRQYAYLDKACAAFRYRARVRLHEPKYLDKQSALLAYISRLHDEIDAIQKRLRAAQALMGGQ